MRLVGTAAGYALNKRANTLGTLDGHELQTLTGGRTSADFYGLQHSGITRPSYNPSFNMAMFHRVHKEKFMSLELIPGEVENMERMGGLINTLPWPFLMLHFSRLALVPLEEGLYENLMEYVGLPQSKIVRWGTMWDDMFFEFSPDCGSYSDSQLLDEVRKFLGDSQIKPDDLDSCIKFAKVGDVLNKPLLPEECSTPKFLRVGRFSTLNNRALAHEAYRQTWEWLVKYHG